MKSSSLILVVVLVALIFAGAGFVGGMQYQRTQNGRGGNFMMFGRNFDGNNQNGNNVHRFNQNGTRAVRGEIISVDDKGITVKQTNGSSRIVFFSDTTKIEQSTAAAKTDLTNGKQVMIFGTTNSDGSVTAQDVLVNPQDFFGQLMGPGGMMRGF